MVIQPLPSIFPALNDLIRQVELNNENSLLSSQPNVAGNQQTVPDPNSPSSQNSSSNRQLPINVTGTDSSQVAQLNVTSAGSYGTGMIQGQILSAATAATLSVVGSAGAVAAASGHYQLAGSLGSADLYLAAGESLYSAAFGINQDSAQTGVSATVDGNNLVLTSNQVGSNALVSLKPYGASPQIVQGVNSQQINSFRVLSQTPSTTDSLSGTVTSSAEGAQLVYQGALGATVGGSASFRLTGSLGSTSVSLTAGQSLSSVASSINHQTALTGLIATVSGNDLLLTSSTTGAAATVKIDSVTNDTGNTISGIGSSQVAGLTVSSLNSGAQEVLTGSVLHAASGAQVALQGSASGTVIDSATFNLSGTTGTAQISIAQGESLANVVSQVNALTSSTGVIAQVDGNQVVFQSVGVGSAAQVNVQLTDISHSPNVTGVNAQQLSGFTVNSLTTGASDSLNGTIDQTATQASLTLQGTSQGTIAGTATFQLTGAFGSTDVSVTQGQSLSSVAAQVNSLTASTGVVATVVSNDIVFQSSEVGSAANVAVNLTSISHTNVVSGVNSQQLSGFTVNNFATGASETFDGQVTRAAAQAQVSLQGSSSGTVISSNTFNVTGSSGTAQISITQGETLSAVAAQVNALTGTTGVVAQVSGNQVNFSSVDAGSSQSVAVTRANVDHATTVAGVNSQQLTSFTVNSFATGGSETLNGSITNAATSAQLTFTGSSGKVNASSTFTLTGSQGSAVFTTTTNETLSSLASQINAVTSTTGVQAVVAGNTLTLSSTDVGSTAVVGVNTTTGTFNVTGGNANGTANGTNALATINGQTITGAGNSFSFSDALGNYSFTTASGFTGAIDPIGLTQADQLTGSTYTTSVSGVNSQQLTNVQANTFAQGNSTTLSGTVTQSATGAQLTYAGSLGLITSSSTFTLSGSLGSAVFSTTGLEALSTLAAQVNAATSTTGVQAVVSGNNLNFVSTGIGSSASVAVKASSGSFNTTGGFGNGTAIGTNAQAVINSQSLTGNGDAFQFSDSKGTYSFNTVAGFTGAINTVTVGQVTQAANAAYTTSITGVNAAQVSDFEANSFAKGASNSLSGTITRAGTSAQLTFTGTGGKAHTNSTFTLTGSLGSASFTTTNGETLTSLAAQINSSTTGIQATVSGNTLTLQSSGVGSGALVGVATTSGTFNVSGGYGNGNARGTDALAVINGQSLTGNGNTFQFSDAVGTYSLTTAAGYTGTLSSINVASTVGQFNVTGGNGNGTGTGVDAQATVNGQTLTGNGNSFQFSDSLGSYSFQTTQGFTGTLNPISVVSQADQFNLTGGNGNGTASGTNAIATINGQSVTGNGNAFQYSDGVGSYSFSAVPGYVGAIDAVNILSQAGQFTLTGGNGAGSSTGTDAQAEINGQQLTGTGNLFSISDTNGAYQLQFVNGFQGTFDPITVQSNSADFQITGGDGNGTSTGSDFAATINGVQYTGATNNVSVAGNHGTYAINFANGFAGNFDPITVTASSVNSGNVVLGGVGGTAFGTDAVAEINGIVQTGKGSTFTIDQNGAQATIGFANGFTGTFNRITFAQSANGSDATSVSNPSTTASATTPLTPAASNSNSSTALVNLQLIQMQVNHQYVLSELEDLYSQVAPSTSLSSFMASQRTNSNTPSNQPQSDASSSAAQVRPSPKYDSAATAASARPANQVNHQA